MAEETANILSSCIEGEALMVLEEGGKAPILDYNLEQPSAFTTYGHQSLDDIEEIVFNDTAFEFPRQELTDLQNTTDEVLVGNIQQDLDNDGGGIIQGTDRFELPQEEEVSQDSEVTQNVVQQAHFDASYIADRVRAGDAPYVRPSFGNFTQIIDFTPRPKDEQNNFIAKPTLFIIEEYVTESHLGDYGAGKTLKVESVYPNEETEIIIKTFKELKSVQSRAKNIMDSFSQESAREMERLLENESTRNHNTSNSKESEFGGSLGFSIGKITKKISGGIFGRKKKSKKSVRTASTRNINKSISKHAQLSNSSREININTSTEDSRTESEEIGITRRFKNPNQSRVLNFVFRELIQEYISITYLNDIKIGFTNGHPESERIYAIEELDDFLEQVVKPEYIESLRKHILHDYLKVDNFEESPLPFIVPKTFVEAPEIVADEPEDKPQLAELIATNIDRPHALVASDVISKDRLDLAPQKLKKIGTYYTKNKSLEDSYQVNAERSISVKGVILDITRNTLRTPAVVVDALLGRGEALDCYAMQAQESNTKKRQIENDKDQLILDTLSAITDPAARAEAMAKIFNPPNTIVKDISTT